MLFCERKQLRKKQTRSATSILPFSRGEFQRKLGVFLSWGLSSRKAVWWQQDQGSSGQTTHAGSELNRSWRTWEGKSILEAESVATEDLAIEEAGKIELSFFINSLLRYNSYTIKFTLLNCILQWMLVYLQIYKYHHYLIVFIYTVGPWIMQVSGGKFAFLTPPKLDY